VTEPAHDWPRLQPARELALGFVPTLLLVLGAVMVSRLPGTVAAVWLANGWAIGLAASAARAHVVPLLLACGAGQLVANLLAGDPPGLALAFLLANGLEVVIAVALLRRGRRAERLLQDERGLLEALLFGALLPPLAGACAAAVALHGIGFASFERVAIDWYLGAALGAVVMLPLVLAVRAAPAASLRRLAEPASLLALALLALVTLAAVRWMPHPFIVITVALSAVVFVRPRVVGFAGALKRPTAAPSSRWTTARAAMCCSSPRCCWR
jgi:diguanylate cyclase